MLAESVCAQDSLQRVAQNASDSRLLMAPTANSLSADNGYINFAGVIFPNFGYGISDEFMIRGGFTPFTVSDHVLYFGLASLQVADYGYLKLAGGVALTDITGSSRGWESAIYGFGIASYGTEAGGVHLGFGGGYSGKTESNSAIFMIGADYRISKSSKIISENWIVAESGSGAYSLAIRISGTALSGDLGAVMITASGDQKVTGIIPWIGLTFFL